MTDDLKHPVFTRFFVRSTVKEWQRRTSYGKMKMLPEAILMAIMMPVITATLDAGFYLYSVWNREKERLPSTYKEDA